MKTPKRSPLTGRPLRFPGQSVDEQRAKLIEDKLLFPATLAAFFLILTFWEWWRHFHPNAHLVYMVSATAVVAVAFTAWRFWRVRSQSQALRLAADGEKVVGQFLEGLRKQGYQVFHDVVGEGFNLDHVLIGPAGVFSVETKTYSKPVGRNARVVFEGGRLRVDGFEPQRDPVAQARGQAAWLKKLLTDSTGRAFAVRPVIVFPGWFVEARGADAVGLWVLEPKALPGFLEHAPAVLSKEDAHLAGFHLSRFLRSDPRRPAAG